MSVKAVKKRPWENTTMERSILLAVAILLGTLIYASFYLDTEPTPTQVGESHSVEATSGSTEVVNPAPSTEASLPATAEAPEGHVVELFFYGPNTKSVALAYGWYDEEGHKVRPFHDAYEDFIRGSAFDQKPGQRGFGIREIYDEDPLIQNKNPLLFCMVRKESVVDNQRVWVIHEPVETEIMDNDLEIGRVLDRANLDWLKSRE